MPFIRLSDDYDEHPKIARLSDGAFRLWHQVLAYSRRFETDGHVALPLVKTRTAYSAKRLTELLTPHEAGAAPLCRKDGDVLVLHDYLQWNHSKAETDEMRKRDAERQARKRSAKSHAVTSPVTHAVTPQSVPGMGMDQDLPEGVQGEGSADRREQPDRRADERRMGPRRLGRGVFAGALPADHLDHAVCGRVCLHQRKFVQFVSKIGGDARTAEARVRAWAEGELAKWDRPPLASQPIAVSDFAWWDARWQESFASVANTEPRRVVPGVDATAALIASVAD